jgi:hypothetical protein
LGRSTELVSGDSKNEIKTLVKLAHCGRHWFMNSVVCAMETKFEETQNHEFDVVEFSNQEQTTSLVSSFYHSKYRI